MKLTLKDLIDLVVGIARTEKNGYLIIRHSSHGWQVMIGRPGFKAEEYLALTDSYENLEDAVIAKIKSYTKRVS